MDIKKNGFLIKKNFFTKKQIDKYERELIFFIHIFYKKYSHKISKKAKNILNLKSKNFRIKAIKLFEEIEKFDKKLFYEISILSGRMFGLTTLDIIKKNILFLKKYFGRDILTMHKKNPVLTFSLKNVSRLYYEWHQESQFYPNQKIGLHLWIPLFRDIKKDNDGGLKLAVGSHKKNYKYRAYKARNGWRQKVPKINVEKNFKIFSTNLNRGDVVFFENKLMHKTDLQLNDLPRVAVVFRYFSSSNPTGFRSMIL